MLPGFRFLFAAIVLSMSVLVFGLGAAALLRAAHEQFASTPAWRAAPEPKFAHWNHLPRDASRQTSSETPGGPPRETTREIAEEEGLREHETPVLGMLRVEPEPVPPQAAESIPESTIEAEPAVVTAAPDEPEQTAALEPRDSPPPEAAMPAMPIPELSVQSVATAAPAAAEETRMTATEQAVQPAHEAVAPAVEPTVAPSAAPAEIVAAKVATLGGPSVAVKTPPPAKVVAKPDRDLLKKRLQARRAKERRRIALRARQAAAQQAAAQQAAAQQQASNPFAQPPFTTRSR